MKYKRKVITIMRYVTLSEFVDNMDEIMENALVCEEMANIETKEGEHLVLMAEQQYECFIEVMAKRKRSFCEMDE